MKKIKDIENISVEADGDIIFITVAKYKLLYSYGKIGLDAYLLYSHLMFTARIQHTNSVYAKDIYLRKGLNWGSTRLSSAKNLLLQLKLIEISQKRKNGKFSKSYITVKTRTSPLEIKEYDENNDTVTLNGVLRENGTRDTRTKCLNEKDKCLNEKGKIYDVPLEQSSKQINNSSKKRKTQSKFVEYWNMLADQNPNLTKHKKIESNVYQKSKLLIKQLRRGLFHKKNIVDKEFLKKNKIPEKLLSKKWTDEEIYKGLDNLSKYFISGNFPGANSNGRGEIRKGKLDVLLFNPNTCSSIFIWVFFREPVPSGGYTKDLHPIFSDQYKKLFNNLNENDNNKVIRAVNSIVKRHKEIIKKLGKYMSHGSFSSYVGSDRDRQPFITRHIEWLSQKDKLNISMLFPDGSYWNYFIDWFKEYYGYNLDPNEKEMKDIVFNYEYLKKDIENSI